MESFQLRDVVQVLLFAAALVGVYVKLQIKMKEFEMKLLAMEERVSHVERQDEKIMEKLEEINRKLFDIKLELQNKQNK